MRTLRWWSLLTLLSALISPAGAAVRPSFSLDYSSFHATDILLVQTGSDGDSFAVVESWKGNVGVGENLIIPELRPSADGLPISAYPASWPDSNGWEAVPKQPPGSRMILFLRRNASGGPPHESDSVSGRHVWLPSDLMHSMKASVVWVEGSRMYCFTQHFNPGPTTLNVMPGSPGELRTRVAEVVETQRNMEMALAATEEHQRAEALKPYVRSGIFPVQQFALEQLGKSGPAAAPTIRGMLDETAFADQASELVEALVKAGGKGVGEDLNRRLLQELAFWKSAAPSLPVGWWNVDPSIHAPLREEYGKALQLVIGIGQIRYFPALASVTQLRNFWRSLPQLNDPSGLDQMVEECDKSIRHLAAN
jgi:hypothetical protein